MSQGTCLMDGVLEWDNLMMAFHNAAKGKADRKEVIAFRKNLDRNILELQKDLAGLTMKFGSYSFFRIHDPKTRGHLCGRFQGAGGPSCTDQCLWPHPGPLPDPPFLCLPEGQRPAQGIENSIPMGMRP